MSGFLSLAYAVARGLPARDWRPGVAALASGFIAANAAFVVVSFGALDAPTLCVVWAGGFAMLLCALWHLMEPRSWHVAWDAFVRLSGRIHPLGSVVFLTTLLVTLTLLLLRALRAFQA
ncbi:MAG TPA: hypothetical protein VFZ61_34395 [Polyangiales bacterium]